MYSGLLRNFKIFSILLFLAVFLILIDDIGVLNLPKAGVQYITSPIQYGLYRTSLNVGKQFEFIFLTRRTLQEKKALEEQLAVILSENARLSRKLAETESFLKQQESLNPQTFNLVATRPIGVNRYLILDKGSDDGLKVNQTVIYKDNYIGQIKSLSPKRSEVTLLYDPDSKVSAYVANEKGKAKGVLLGQFGSQELLDKILHAEPVEVDDLVYTDGTEVEIPKGLILGQVSEVMNRDNEVFKQAKVKSVFDVSNLDVVFVITN
jgi:rod shape-determining protein MreC